MLLGRVVHRASHNILADEDRHLCGRVTLVTWLGLLLTVRSMCNSNKDVRDGKLAPRLTGIDMTAAARNSTSMMSFHMHWSSASSHACRSS